MTESVVGRWEPEQPFELQNVAVHASLLPNGKVLYWGRRGNPKVKADDSNLNEHSTSTYIWDPSTKTSQPIAKEKQPKLENGQTVNLFCSGHCLQPDGTLLVAGGHEFDGQGVSQACVYHPETNEWTAQKPMIRGRWYPSALTLTDGRVLAISGSFSTGYEIERIPQIWQKDAWVSVTAPPKDVLPLYPRLHLSPDGRVFMAGPQAQSRFLDVNAKANSAGFVGEWTAENPDLMRKAGSREYAPSVTYDSGKIMYIGGGNDPDPDLAKKGDFSGRLPGNIVEFIDLKSKPKWKSSDNPAGSSNMKHRRQQHNATVLPDGTVLVTGGSEGTGFNNLNQTVHIPELWEPPTSEDPLTSKWTEMAKESADRCYHSIALLLPDGQVLSAGGGEYDKDLVHNNGNFTNAQLFKPPYFFKGPRPTVSNAPKEIKYGEVNAFTVTVGISDLIKRASWVRLGSVTHTLNFNQSFMFLKCKQNGSTVTMTPPASANEAPPGHYMLFLLNQANLPSMVAPIICIGPVPPAPPKSAPAPAQRMIMTQRVGLSNSELNEKIITEQARPAVAVGLTPLCPYGLGPCWGGAHEALHQISDIEVVRPLPSQADSVAFVYLKQDILPDIDVWRSEFESTANGSYVMRGIEMTLSGVVTKKPLVGGEQLKLAGTTTRPELVLEPFQASSQIQWDKDAQAPKPINDAEAGAYAQLSAALADHAAGATVQVTGWLQKHGANKFSLHVRKFET